MKPGDLVEVKSNLYDAEGSPIICDDGNPKIGIVTIGPHDRDGWIYMDLYKNGPWHCVGVFACGKFGFTWNKWVRPINEK